jgi:hypothetical protein
MRGDKPLSPANIMLCARGNITTGELHSEAPAISVPAISFSLLVYATPMLYYCTLRRYLVSWCEGESVRIMCVFLVNVSMNCWCLLEPSSAFTVTLWDNLVRVHMDFEECFVALRMISVRFPLENCFELHIDDSIY